MYQLSYRLLRRALLAWKVQGSSPHEVKVEMGRVVHSQAAEGNLRCQEASGRSMQTADYFNFRYWMCCHSFGRVRRIRNQAKFTQSLLLTIARQGCAQAGVVGCVVADKGGPVNPGRCLTRLRLRASEAIRPHPTNG